MLYEGNREEMRSYSSDFAESVEIKPQEDISEIQLVPLDSSPGHPVRQTYTVEEVATILNCHPATVRKLCREEKIKSVSLGPRIRRIPRVSLEEFLGFKIE